MVKRLIILLAFGGFPITSQESPIQSVKSARTSGEEPTCFQLGECAESLYVSHWTTNNAMKCLTECQNDQRCHYFTYYADLDECAGFFNCEVFSDETCTNCYSGKEICEGVQCSVPGECNGILLDEVQVYTSRECLDVCKANSVCQWFTFDSRISLCFLFENCPFLQTDCTTCTSGQRYCPSKDYTKLMVIGGFGDSNDILSSVEVVDLEAQVQSCELVANYPLNTYDLTVQLVDGVVNACGGINTEDNCFNYDPFTDTWDSITGPQYGKDGARSSIIDGTWLVSGDLDDPDGYMTEMWTGAEFILGPTLPELMYRHCQVTINATHVFFVDTYDGTTLLLDWNLQEWTQLDDKNYPDGQSCGCGLIHNDEMGKEVVVACYGRSEIFNFDELTWRDGPDFPYTYGYASVQLTDTFLLVGGYMYADRLVSNDIYIFDKDHYEFTLMDQSLLYPRQYPGAVVVPDELVNCS